MLISIKWKRIIYLSLFLFILIFLFEIYPSIDSTISSINIKIFSNREIDELEELLESEKNRNLTYKNNMVNFFNNLNNGKGISETISFLDKASAFSKLEIKSIKPIDENANNSSRKIEITAESSYENLFNFVKYMEQENILLTIHKILITHNNSIIGLIKSQINVEIYNE